MKKEIYFISLIFFLIFYQDQSWGLNTTIEDEEWLLQKMATHEAAIFSLSKVHVFRLGPNEDLLDSIFRYARATGIEAAMIVTCVGR